MAGMKISELDFVRLLPAFMKDDEAVIALAKAVNLLLQEPSQRLNVLPTWDKADTLTETECDELAWELDIDWYNVGMSLEEKRQTIGDALMIKSKRGTKWAVERVISTYLGEGGVVEWCDSEVPGVPFTFEVYTSNETVTEELFNQFHDAAAIAKNERSHMIGMSHRYMLGDRVTGQRYNLYVINGRLTMQEARATVEVKDILLTDAETGTAYCLYVLNGSLMMESTTETSERDVLPFKDARTGTTYNVYVENGDLRMKTA